MRRIKNIFINLWKVLFSKEELFVLVRIGIMLIFAVIFHFLFLGQGVNGKYKVYYSFVRDVLAIISVFQCRHFYKKGTVASGLKKIAINVGTIIGRVMSFIVKIPIWHRTAQSKYKIKGFEDTEEKITYKYGKTAKKYRYKSWNKMNAKEKVRYLYYKNVLKWRKKGITIKVSDTPKEIQNKASQIQEVKPLVSIYNDIRYNNGVGVTDEMCHSLDKDYR